MIVASRYGWSAVSGPDRMTFTDLLLAVQLQSEEKVGTRVREHAREQTKKVSKLRKAAR